MSTKESAFKPVYPRCQMKGCRRRVTTVLWLKEPKRALRYCSVHAVVTIHEQSSGDVTWSEAYV